MQKKKAGFSYIEVLAACALFVIVLTGVLSMTLGARQNLSAARESQRLRLAASSLSLAVRDMMLGGQQVTDASIRSLALSLGIENYSVFIFGPGGENMHGSPFHSSEDGEDISLGGFASLARGRDSQFVYVVARNYYYAQVGRAISVVIDFDHTSGMWRNAGG